MRHVDMSVKLISRPSIDWQALDEWVVGLGGQEWIDRAPSGHSTDGEILIEAGGRRCYQSWTEGLNVNVSRVRKDSAAYLRHIVDVGHGSVIEHANYSFALEGISRVVTHELVRHRHPAISQESLRFVRLTDIPFRIPAWIDEDPILHDAAVDLLYAMEQFQLLAADRGGLDAPDTDFHFKKERTSDMRRFAPLGLLTGMVWTANLRTLRQVIEARTSEGAEREIRELFHKIGLLMLIEAPAIFDDFTQTPVLGSEIPAWTTPNSKV